MTAPNLVGFVYNSRVANAADFVKSLVDALGLRDRSWVCCSMELEQRKAELKRSSVLVVAGGDGTILRTVRIIAPFKVPIVGINMGRVGFMTELKIEEAAERLPTYLNKADLRIEERMMLEASVVSESDGKPRYRMHALNDVVVGRGGVARILDIHASVDGVHLTTYRSDAVIVSTATGSTGYALSAGGPILYPEICAMLIQPVAAHTGLDHGLVLPDTAVVELRATDGHEAVLSVDGFPDMALQPKDTVTIKKSPYVARFLRAHPPNAFYMALTRRLGFEHYTGA